MAGYIPPAEAFGGGLERGVRIISQVREDQRRDDENRRRQVEADRKWQFDTEDRDRRREKDQWDREDREDKQNEAELKLLEGPVQAARGEYQDLVAKYGEAAKVPTELLGPVNQRLKQAADAYDDGERRLRAPRLERMRKRALDELKKFDPRTADPDKTAINLELVARRPLTDLLQGPNGEPPLVVQAEQQMMQAMEAGDNNGMVAAANVLFRPELETGVGTRGRDGSPIVSKRIVGFAPSPNGDGKVLPVLEVTTEQGKYVAGVTKNRSAQDGDPYIAVDIGEALDRVGHMVSLANAVNSPQMRQIIDQRSEKAAATAEEARKQYNRVGSLKAPTGRYRQEKTDLGNRVVTETFDQGTGEVLNTRSQERGMNPDRQALITARERGLAITEAGKNQRAATRAAGGGGGSQFQLVEGEDEDGNRVWVRIPKSGPTGVVDTTGGNPDAPKAAPKPRRDPERQQSVAEYNTTWGSQPDRRPKNAPTIDEFEQLRTRGFPANTPVNPAPKSADVVKSGQIYRGKDGQLLRAKGDGKAATFEPIK